MARVVGNIRRPRRRGHGERRITATVAAAVLYLGVGCTPSAPSHQPGTGPGVVLGGSEEPVEPHNEADVTFAQAMIAYHEQSAELAILGETHGQKPEIRAIAQRIRLIQEAEVNQLTEWLEEWSAEAPSPSPSAELSATPLAFPQLTLPPITAGPPSADPSPQVRTPAADDTPSPRGSGATPRPRRAKEPAELLAELKAAPAHRFDQLFIDAMIAHHERAIRIAETEQLQGRHPGARELAARIVKAQRADIKQLEELRE